MSTILHRRDCHVAISALDAGLEFAEASADVQADFLKGMAYAIADYRANESWNGQCVNIAKEIDGEARRKIRLALSTLVEYLTDTTEAAK